ncbi:presenilins-associated rhomboid-like protein, mitochondrial isoform X1 [Pocillopora damicornis]|uniref:presenilins-associated rhomboid-like protein, mitochondrial isoform X1 n=2 Tax=Pocillopora damicornis TaxID=46731 RepID=UPI000F54EFB3|nr:presenilins-associated rhomboid-like protein, mitochondrial isoform X1 [Pocillopora damicornis]
MAAVFVPLRRGIRELSGKTSSVRFPFHRSRSRQFHPRERTPGQNGRTSGKNENQPEISDDVSKLRMIVRPLGFTVLTGVVSFGTCSIINYERVRNLYVQGKRTNKSSSHSSKSFDFRNMLNKWWNSLHGGSKTAAVIIFINTAVLLLWYQPRLHLFMYKWFTTSPFSGSSLTMLTSVFSHKEIWHLSINMFVLWNFAPHLEALLGKEQFIAFYITGGVFASFLSQACRIGFTNAFRVGASLGASGALLACLSLVCINEPDLRLSIVFLPFFTFPAGVGLLAVAGFDLLGLLMRWRVFDHAAHLGGVLFGALYLKYGSYYIWQKRGWFVSEWHKLREGSKRT